MKVPEVVGGVSKSPVPALPFVAASFLKWISLRMGSVVETLCPSPLRVPSHISSGFTGAHPCPQMPQEAVSPEF